MYVISPQEYVCDIEAKVQLIIAAVRKQLNISQLEMKKRMTLNLVSICTLRAIRGMTLNLVSICTLRVIMGMALNLVSICTLRAIGGYDTKLSINMYIKIWLREKKFRLGENRKLSPGRTGSWTISEVMKNGVDYRIPRDR